VSPGNYALSVLPQSMNPASSTGLALLNSEVTRQGVLIGYLSDFGIMMAVTLAAIPLLLLIRSPGRAPAGAAAEVPH
jgi:DHA2 family multidrug resistance protein